MLWDQHSNIYVRQTNKTLYIPSLLLTHEGMALDDKTLFRQTQQKL
jgi:glutamine synthetase type III